MAIIYEKKDNVAYLIINRPEAMNSLGPQDIDEIGRVSSEFNDDDNVFALVITGAGDTAFCTGVDLENIALPVAAAGRSAATEFWKKGWQLYQSKNFARGMDVWKPIIAAVNGQCFSTGFELALACDLRVASENAVFGLPEVQMGSMVGWGATQRLPCTMPLGVAMKMLLTGESINAQQAVQWGLVTDVVPLPELMPTVDNFIQELNKCGPLSLKAIKEASLRGLKLPLEYGMLMQRLFFDILRDTEDRIEGRKAFAEKRKPEYRGR